MRWRERLAFQKFKTDFGALAEFQGEADPEHGEGLQESGLDERPAIERNETNFSDESLHYGLCFGIVTAIAHDDTARFELRVRHDVVADCVEGFHDFGAGSPL